ncbi:Starch synthase [Methanocaldococcus vulcanius M7]|uniref:Starch synthase n=1 Tax=Methanocaldococcus vulcanius (strain ATCC 700851 / DSM 12094 / M7) TaxID=579137 RepID=C9RGE0_METVM|nr:glycogen synthase [Methanocaldococcus vulcanius]ACX72642.1 Starch synthase [Methanocaldococcus vulcanius M7]
MKIVVLAPTITPIVSYGGLGDVMRDLPKFLEKENEVLVLTLNHNGRYFKLPYEKIKTIKIMYKGTKIVFDVIRTKHPTTGIELIVFSNENVNNLDVWDPVKYEIFADLVIAYLDDVDKLDVVSGHDWMCGLAIAKCSDILDIPTTLTIHNEAFKGDVVEYKGEVMTFLELGLKYADAVNTVSPTHAEEIKNLPHIKRYIENKPFCGILNGIDIEEYDPVKIIDRMIALSNNKLDPRNYAYISPYSAEDAYDIKPKIKYSWFYKGGIFEYIEDWNKIEKEISATNVEVHGNVRGDIENPMIGFVGRATYQKGFNTIFETIPEVLKKHDDIRFVFLTKGDRDIENKLKDLADEYEDNILALIGYSLPLSSLVFAGSDWIMMPSYWEPCGLVQMEAMAYCTPVIATETGGLKDTIIPLDPNPCEHPNFDKATGVLFKVPDKLGLMWGIEHALNWTFYKLNEICMFMQYLRYECPKYPYDKNAPLSMMMKNCYHHVFRNLSWQNSPSIRRYKGLFGGGIYQHCLK